MIPYDKKVRELKVKLKSQGKHMGKLEKENDRLFKKCTEMENEIKETKDDELVTRWGLFAHWIKYEDYEKLGEKFKELAKKYEVSKLALSLSFKSDACVYPERRCPTDRVEGEHQCYGCYIEKSRELLDKSHEEGKVT